MANKFVGFPFAKRSALKLQATHGCRRKRVEITRLHSTQIPFCIYMQRYRKHDIVVEPAAQQFFAKHFVTIVDASFRRDSQLVNQMADIVQQRRRYHRRAGTRMLRLRCALQRVLQLCHRLAVIVISIALRRENAKDFVYCVHRSNRFVPETRYSMAC